MDIFKSVLVVFALIASACQASAKPSPRLAYYCGTYESCRANFLASAQPYVREGAQLTTLKVPSQVDQQLYIDTLYLRARDSARNLLVLSSGVHGVEGFGGSSFQQYFFKEVLPKVDRSHLGILLIHAVNPYGFKYGRRVSENNVDLNRNFDVDHKLFSSPSGGYSKLNPLLNPEKPATAGVLSYAAFLGSVVNLIVHEPMKTLRQAILRGQYEYPKGIYFGGKDFEPQKALLEPLLLEVAAPYHTVLALDLHTGYGTRGVLHLFPAGQPSHDVQAASEKLFAGFKVEDVTGPDFYENSGDFSTWVAKLLENQNKIGVPMTFEFGTFNNQGYYGGIESLRRMIVENQAHWYGTKGKNTARTIARDMRELYFPSATKWREQVMGAAAYALPLVVDRLAGF